MKNYLKGHLHEEPEWRIRLHKIIYEADTPAGKLFDIILLYTILASIIVVILESVHSINVKYGKTLNVFEWIFTIIFTLEYIVRIITASKPKNYIFSYWGVIDLLATIPKYLSLFLSGSHFIIVVRSLRLLRVFRILKLGRHIGEANILRKSIIASKEKITVFLGGVLTISIITGTIMYIVEGNESGFNNIPKSIYWTIVTLTTVGYGDIAPITPLGQFIASILMLIGYGIIAIPTGIVTAKYLDLKKIDTNTIACVNCGESHHKDNAKYCFICGDLLEH